MDKSQFQLPDYTVYTEQDARAELAALQYVPERVRPLEPFRFMVDIEEAVLSIRDTRKAIELRHERRVTVFGIPLPIILPSHTEEYIEKKLTDQEWKIGGDLFGKNRGFQFGLGPRDDHYKQTGMLGWYHITPNVADAKKPTVVHFDVTPLTLTMSLENGRPYAPTLQDIERLAHGAYHYLQRVRELSPVDATLDELIKEITIPDNISELVNDTEQADGTPDDYVLAA